MDDSILPRSILLVLLLFGSAFFSACEAAFFSLSRVQLNDLKDKMGRKGRRVYHLMEKPRELLITIYIGNELVNIACSVVVTSISISILGNVGISLAIGVGTLLLLIFGEVIPKSLSLQSAVTYALWASTPLKIFSNAVQPVRRFFMKIAEKLISAIGFASLNVNESAITDEEFKAMVQVGEGEGVIDSEESTLIHNVIAFGETSAGDVMTPKIDMFSLSISDTYQDILPKIIENFFSRVPVFDQDGETVVGILYTKDLNRFKQLPPDKFNLKGILHPPYSVPASKKIKELLEEFRKRKQHMAIVLDEYGSVSGLVTLEDLAEELVGEIDSEMRDEESPLVKIKENKYRLTASLPISDFNNNFEEGLPYDEHGSVGGFVFGLFGRVPRSGETVPYNSYEFRVEKMKGPRILKLHMTVLIETPENSEKESAPS